MKLGQLVNPACISALQKIRASSPPVALAFRFLQLWDAIEPALRRYEEQRLELLRRYAREGDSGEFRFVTDSGEPDHEAAKAFIAEHNRLLEEEIIIPALRFSVDELEQFNARLTVEEIAAVRWMIDAGESTDTG